MTAEATLARIREYMVGPSRFINLLSCFELGIIDRLRDDPGLTAADLGEAVGAKPDAVEQLLMLLVKEGFVAQDEGSGGYRLDALAGVAEDSLRQVLADMDLIKVVTSPAAVLPDRERAAPARTVGLKELYGYEGNLFGALAEHDDLRESWARLMDSGHLQHRSLVLREHRHPDRLAGARPRRQRRPRRDPHLRHKASPGLRVTTSTCPRRKRSAWRTSGHTAWPSTARSSAVTSSRASPQGFDVVLIKHFLPCSTRATCSRSSRAVNQSLETGGQVNVLVPVFPENIKDTADSAPSTSTPASSSAAPWDRAAAEAVGVAALVGGMRIRGDPGRRGGPRRDAAQQPPGGGRPVRQEDRLTEAG